MLMKISEVPGPAGPGNFGSTSSTTDLMNSSVVTKRHFTLGAKIPVKDSFTEAVPGPGAYNIRLKVHPSAGK